MEDWPASAEITSAAIAEPARARCDVGVLRDPKVRMSARDETLVGIDCRTDLERLHQLPPVLHQHPGWRRTSDRQNERPRRPARQLGEPHELSVLVAVNVAVQGYALPPCPLHHGGDWCRGRSRNDFPELRGNNGPRRNPLAPRQRDRTIRHSDP